MAYFAETYGLCWETLGLGCYQAEGASPHGTYIERPGRHLKADTDPSYQNDMVLAAKAYADPARYGRTYHRWLRNTTEDGETAMVQFGLCVGIPREKCACRVPMR